MFGKCFGPPVDGPAKATDCIIADITLPKHRDCDSCPSLPKAAPAGKRQAVPHGKTPAEPSAAKHQTIENKRKIRQTACKPGSVPARRRWMTIPLGRPLPDASRDRPGWRRGNAFCRLPGLPSLFGLAPGGVCRATAVAGGAVRSCRTLSPLPAFRGKPAVCSLLHFPWGRPRRALPGTVFPWSPDFPRHPKMPRSSSRLAFS